MRYINLDAVLESIPENILDTLRAADEAMPGKTDAEKSTAAANGNNKWTPVKQYLENASNRKCWYTESMNPGYPNDVEHYRPKGRVPAEGDLEYWYWFLAFNPMNYRLSCQFSNRLNKNPLIGETGGKWDYFPLLPGGERAVCVNTLQNERPVILDPCVEEDTRLLSFQPDGRPVVSPEYSEDEEACLRVERNKLLLNLDFPTFNEGRERLYNRVVKLIARGDRHAENENDALDDVLEELRELMDEGAAYSKAAECYIRCFRDRDWIEGLFFDV